MQAVLGQNPLKASPNSLRKSPGGYSKTKATLGVMLRGTKVDTLVVGGPAYNSGMLERGDEIIMVGSSRVENEDQLLSLLHGSDEPHTIVNLTVRRGSLERRLELKRMPALMLADNLRMFETFTEVTFAHALPTMIVSPFPHPTISSFLFIDSDHGGNPLPSFLPPRANPCTPHSSSSPLPFFATSYVAAPSLLAATTSAAAPAAVRHLSRGYLARIFAHDVFYFRRR